MATTIFPQNGDSGDETAFSRQLGAPNAVWNHVLSGGLVTVNSGLDVDVSALTAFIRGTYLEVDAAVTLTMTDATTNYIFAELTRSSDLVQQPATDADNFRVATSTNFQGRDEVLIAAVTTTGGGVTNIYDLRWRTPGQTFTRQHDLEDGFITISSQASAENITPLIVPVTKKVDGAFRQTRVRGHLSFVTTVNAGIVVSLRTEELPGICRGSWRAFDESSGLVAQGRFSSNSQNITLLDTTGVFDGVVEFDYTAGAPDDSTPFIPRFAQKTSDTDNTSFRNGYVEVARQ